MQKGMSILVISCIGILFIGLGYVIGTKYIVSKNQIRTDWQAFVDQAMKKTGYLVAKDKTGEAIIIEWHKVNGTDPEFVQYSNEACDLLTKAFLPVYMRFLRTHPDINFKELSKRDPSNLCVQLEPLLEQGYQAVDWELVEKRVEELSRQCWQFMIQTSNAHALYFFIFAQSPANNQLLGVVIHAIDEETQRGAVVCGQFAVLPEKQQRGIGKLLMASTLKIIPALTTIVLGGVDLDNTIALKAYESWGFVRGVPQTPQALSIPMRYELSDTGVLKQVAETLIEKKI